MKLNLAEWISQLLNPIVIKSTFFAWVSSIKVVSRMCLMLSYTFSFFQVHSTYKGFWIQSFPTTNHAKAKLHDSVKSNDVNSIVSSMCVYSLWPLLPMLQRKMGCLPFYPILLPFTSKSCSFHVPPIAIGYHRLSLPLPPSLDQPAVSAPSKMFAHRLRWPNSPQVWNYQTRSVLRRLCCVSKCKVFQRLHLLGLNVTVRICTVGDFRMGFFSCQRLDQSPLENKAFWCFLHCLESFFPQEIQLI